MGSLVAPEDRSQPPKVRPTLTWVIVVPLSALVVAALSLFMAPERPIVFARVIGGPTDHPIEFRGRVFAGRQESGVLVVESGITLTALAKQGNATSRRQLRTDQEGWAEFVLPRDPSEDLFVRIEAEFDGRSTVLAEGRPSMSTARYFEAATRRGERRRAHRVGEWVGCVHLPTGTLSVPFEAPLELRLYQSDGAATADVDVLLEDDCRSWARELPGPLEPAAGQRVVVTGEGLSLTATEATTDAQGSLRLDVRPRHHTSTLRFSIGGKGASFEEVLPVVAGSYWLERGAGATGAAAEKPWIIRSPVSRPSVWWTLVREGRRGPGGRLELEQNEDGTASGFLEPPDGAEEFTHLVLASDPDGRSSSLVGYPLDASGVTLGPSDAYFLDGLGPARARSESHTRGIQWALGAYAVLAALVTVVLFIVVVRRNQRELDFRLEAAGADARTRAGTPWPLVAAILCVFFAFSASLVWILLR